MITRSLSKDTMLIEDAETEIKLIVKKLYLKGFSKTQVLVVVKKRIDRLVAELENKKLVADVTISLNTLADKVYNKLYRVLGANGQGAAAAIGLAVKGKLTPVRMAITGAKQAPPARVVDVDIVPEPLEKGVPLQIYNKDYMKQVNKAMTQIAREQALDPNDVSGRNSLRNLAEMQTRFKTHEDEINGFKENGIKLIVISTHADCSDRCYEWQGRVYSLDGTSGTTPDGRQYVPLEKATDIFYTTKAGKVYKNGLFGFNCRHKAYVYRPNMKIPVVTKEMQQYENAVNNKQREYERLIRNNKEIALFSVDAKMKQKARKEAILLNKQYIAFSKKHKRAYYPDRIKILYETEDNA